jgi:hypothetical protein
LIANRSYSVKFASFEAAGLSSWGSVGGDEIADVGGVGAKREPPVWMKAGDVVEVDISGVGLLVNSVREEA